ncbi:hypothetical protein DL96DRAFT_1599994 [Flagelloscypha sp. PMI_526]|nr:hypothetical protein DL96DRAFT_1599994 [Flagelloscypha sp. PMI_526]
MPSSHSDSPNAKSKLNKFLPHSKPSNAPSITRDRSKSVGTSTPRSDDDEVLVARASAPLPSPKTPRPQSPLYANAPSSHSTSKLTSTGSRLSGWLNHFSSGDTSLPNILSSHSGGKLALAATAANGRGARLSISNTSSSSNSNKKKKGDQRERDRPTSPESTLSSSTSSSLNKSTGHAGPSGSGLASRALRYLGRDTDVKEDGDERDVWLLGVKYSWDQQVPVIGGGETPRPPFGGTSAMLEPSPQRAMSPKKHHKSKSKDIPMPASATHTPNNSLSSTSSTSTASSSSSRQHSSPNTSVTSFHSSVGSAPKGWPPGFYDDFTHRIWLTYRKDFSTPIRDGKLADLERWDELQKKKRSEASESDEASLSSAGGNTSGYTTGGYTTGSTSSTSISSTPSKAGKGGGWLSSISIDRIGIAERVGRSGLLGEKGWTSDTGWGCMLRTGQSLLAEALLRVWVGRQRDPSDLVEQAKYVKLLSWFVDDPRGEVPFSVHRMALAGKELGKDVGMWFGPSTAAGALRTLAYAYPPAHLGVSVASDSMLFETEVFAASRSPAFLERERKKKRKSGHGWGDRPVLVLFGIRLGLEGVNPIYYETIKRVLQFPTSVGIAGGRPSSSYWFVGTQEEQMVYLDPHWARPCVDFKPLPPHLATAPSPVNTPLPLVRASSSTFDEVEGSWIRFPHDDLSEEDGEIIEVDGRQILVADDNDLLDDDDDDGGEGDVESSTSYPGGKRERRDTAKPLRKEGRVGFGVDSKKERRERRDTAKPRDRKDTAKPSSKSGWSQAQLPSPSPSPPVPPPKNEELTLADLTPPQTELQDPVAAYYLSAYPPHDLASYHCDKVRRMHIKEMDPSMLIGFVVRGAEEWKELREGVANLPKHIFSIHDAPPTWSGSRGSSEDYGLASSEDLLADMTEDVEEGLPESAVPAHAPPVIRVEEEDEDEGWEGSGFSNPGIGLAVPSPPMPVAKKTSSSSSSSSKISSKSSSKTKTSPSPSSSRIKSSRGSSSSSAGSGKKERPVPVPRLPFPVAEEDEDEEFVEIRESDERSRTSSVVYVAKRKDRGGKDDIELETGL